MMWSRVQISSGPFIIKTKMVNKINQVKHNLIPLHEKLSEKDRTALLEKYNIESKELPRISIKDVAIQHLDVKEKDVIKITRKSHTAGTTTFYRGVVND
jgi:DNA-directed RNA polymerase subunit H